MLEEGKISEQPQQTFEDIEVRTMESRNIETPCIDLMQKERTPKKGDKGKGIAKKIRVQANWTHF